MGLYLPIVVILLNSVCRHVIEAKAPVLSANAASFTEGSPLKLVCALSDPTPSVTWCRSASTGTTEQTIVTVGMQGGSCMSVPSTPPDGLVVTCGTLEYGCTIPSLNFSDNGNVWRCSVPIGGVTTYSNYLRINVTARKGDCQVCIIVWSVLYIVISFASVAWTLYVMSKDSKARKWLANNLFDRVHLCMIGWVVASLVYSIVAVIFYNLQARDSACICWPVYIIIGIVVLMVDLIVDFIGAIANSKG